MAQTRSPRNEEERLRNTAKPICEAYQRRKIEIGAKSRLQHGEDKQESQQELCHQSVPKTPNHPDSIGTKTLREVLLREKRCIRIVETNQLLSIVPVGERCRDKGANEDVHSILSKSFPRFEETATAHALNACRAPYQFFRALVTLLALSGSI